ncbi:MAG: AAA family ATPase [Carboxydocellales bacterium]
MKYITKIVIRGFQAHVDTTIELDPGMNVLVGPTDSGKSAVVRAIKACLFNEWPKNYINKRVGHAEIIVTFSDGTEILRQRSPSINAYEIRKPEQAPFRLEKFGKDIPLEVLQAHGMKRGEFGDWKPVLNIGVQRGKESDFLLGQNGWTIATVLGKLAGTEAVDLAAKDLQGDIRRAIMARSDAEKATQDIDEKIAGLAYIDDVAKTLEQAQAYIQKAADGYDRQMKISSTLAKYNQVQREIRYLNETLDKLSGLDKATELLEAARKGAERQSNITILVTKINATSDRIQSLEVTIKSTNSLGIAESHLMFAEHNLVKLQAITRVLGVLQSVRTAIAEADQIIQTTINLEQAGESLQRARENLKRRDAITLLLQKLNAIKSYLVTAEVVINKTAGVDEAEKLLAGIPGKLTRSKQIISLLNQLNSVRLNRAKTEEVLIKTEGLDSSEQLLTSAAENITKGNQIVSLLSKYQQNQNEGKRLNTEIQTSDQNILDAQTEINSAVAELGGMCPVLEISCEKLAGGIY